jgi:tryptophan halogenase
VLQFLALHYRAAGRSDTQYWQDARERPLPDGLDERIEEWRNRIPEHDTIYPYYHGFEPYSYICMLMGLGGIPLKKRPVLGLLDQEPARQEFQRIRERGGRLETLPSHVEYLRHMYGDD